MYRRRKKQTNRKRIIRWECEEKKGKNWGENRKNENTF
jgi:hypothetical protein